MSHTTASIDPASLRPPALCDDCGHAKYRHRVHGPPANDGKPDDPTPCFGWVPRRVTTPPGADRPDADHDYCGCTTVHPPGRDHDNDPLF